VISAITASMLGANQGHRRPIAVGVGLGLIASVITWFIAVGIISDLTQSIPALQVQAATGLLAVIVLLIVMNWFFHKVYWTGWISMHNRRKKDLLKSASSAETSRSGILLGFILLGLTSIYREGFEVVLFLQSYMLRMGGAIVLQGVLLGLFFTAIVAALTFVAHQRLPYKRMLVLTGALLGVVLLVMIGEQAFEMQQAGWIPTTTIPWLVNYMPDWMGVWLSIFPTVETLVSQLIAAVLVVGSYYVARYQLVSRPLQRGETPAQRPETPPTIEQVGLAGAGGISPGN